MLGGSVAIPGIVLLNQQYEWYPVNTYLYEFEIGGQSVAPESVARGLVTISVALLSIGILLCLIALRNFQFNKKLAQRIVMHSMTYVITFF